MEKIKFLAQQLWLSVKKYWLHLFYAVGALVAIVLGVSLKQILSERNRVLAGNNNEFEKLQQAEAAARLREQQAQQNYERTVAAINAKNNKALKLLAAEKEKEIKKLSTQFADNPTAMAEEMNKLFGIPIYQTPPQS